MQIKKIKPKLGQESVWDYPRPPRLEDSEKKIQVVFNGVTIAETRYAKRVLETSRPPVYYIPPEDIEMDLLVRVSGTSYCEWKGQACYYSLIVDKSIADKAAWYYPDPALDFSALKDFVAFYPGKVDACYVDGERVTPRPGGFYGGWITKDIVGPFKGEPGTWGW